MRNKKLVLWDMDGVLVDLMPDWFAAFNQFLCVAGERPVKWESIVDYDFLAHPTIAKHQSTFFALLNEKRLFANAPAFPKMVAAAVNQYYARDEYDVRVVTYLHRSAIQSGLGQKQQWLAAHIPGWNPNHLIVAKDKELIYGDVLIEDNPDNIERWLNRHKLGVATMVLHQYNLAESVELVRKFENRLMFARPDETVIA